MKKFRKYSTFLTIIVAIVTLLFSCVDDDYDTPPITQKPIGNVYTIAQIKDSIASVSTYTFNQDASVYATVTMDNETDNSYKTFFIQDNTAAIAVFQNPSGGVYIGDSVRIYLKDLMIMKYNELFQINNTVGTGINIETNLIKQGVNNKRAPELATIEQIASNKSYYQGRLVKIENVQFVDTDTAKTYAISSTTPPTNVSLYIQNANDNQLIVRTSGYSTFADTKVPNGSGSIIAIVGQYNNDIQLVIRKASEVVMENERFELGGGGTVTGSGTKDDPYNVAGAIANNTGIKQWVKGYIVGAAEYVSGTGNIFHFDSPFGSVNTNLFIADDPNETNSANVFVVQLPSGTIRDILNLVSNSDNYKKEVMVRGNLEDYFGQPGMKETIGCIIDEIEYGETTDVEAILYEDFSSIAAAYDPITIAGWKVIMEAGTIDWHGDGYNGQSAEISAYQSGEASNIAWLITPAVDLSATTSPYLSFYSALKYFAGDILSVYVSTNYDGGNSPQTATWTELTSANIVTTSDPEDAASGYYYTESGNVDLSAYKSASVYIAFKYVGSNTLSTKYRVDNVKIAEL
ncbi:MAG: DUF5689 domain-containing protein [Bacteroidales bacterium]